MEGAIAVVSSTAHQRYFHWMYDVLPRLDLLWRSKIKIDRYVINTDKPFQRETLETLNIDPAQIICPSSETYIEAEKLVVPSLLGEIGFVTPEACKFLRSNFLRSSLDLKPERLLYITRRDALTRRVLNETDVIDCLGQFGFEVTELGNRSVAEQARLFASARIIVGPHGAGFTNLVFAKGGTAVIEFMPETYFNPCFEILAGIMSLEYRCVPSRSLPAKDNDQFVDTSSVEQAVRLFLN